VWRCAARSSCKPDPPAQTPQTSDVWPRQARPASRPHLTSRLSCTESAGEPLLDADRKAGVWTADRERDCCRSCHHHERDDARRARCPDLDRRRRIREKKQRVLPQMQGPLLVGRSVSQALQKTYLRLERILSVRVARADAACLVGNLPPQVFRAVGAHLQLLTHALQQAMCTICQCASVQRRAVASGSAATVLARSRRNARAQCSPSTTRCSICAAERSILLS
jgi:hypothetical protein